MTEQDGEEQLSSPSQGKGITRSYFIKRAVPGAMATVILAGCAPVKKSDKKPVWSLAEPSSAPTSAPESGEPFFAPVATEMAKGTPTPVPEGHHFYEAAARMRAGTVAFWVKLIREELNESWLSAGTAFFCQEPGSTGNCLLCLPLHAFTKDCRGYEIFPFIADPAFFDNLYERHFELIIEKPELGLVEHLSSHRGDLEMPIFKGRGGEAVLFDWDLILFEVVNLPAHFLNQALPLAPRNSVTVGMDLLYRGYPRSITGFDSDKKPMFGPHYWHELQMKVSSQSSDGNYFFLEHPSGPGFSGGIVTNTEGKVMGLVITSAKRETQMIPVDRIWDLLGR